jgi:hypothetical protein
LADSSFRPGVRPLLYQGRRGPREDRDERCAGRIAASGNHRSHTHIFSQRLVLGRVANVLARMRQKQRLRHARASSVYTIARVRLASRTFKSFSRPCPTSTFPSSILLTFFCTSSKVGASRRSLKRTPLTKVRRSVTKDRGLTVAQRSVGMHSRAGDPGGQQHTKGVEQHVSVAVDYGAARQFTVHAVLTHTHHLAIHGDMFGFPATAFKSILPGVSPTQTGRQARDTCPHRRASRPL